MGSLKKGLLPKYVLPLLLCLGMAFSLLLCTTEKKPPVGLSPDFTLKSLEGQEITLSRFRGKVVLLDFWATWCGPCRESTPHFVQIYKTFRESGFELIGLSLDKGNPQVVRNFIQSMDIPYPIVMASEEVIRNYRVTKIPTTFLIDRKGVIRESAIGFDRRMAQQMTSKIAQLTSENP